MIIAGSKIYERCSNCNKLVQINKFLVGGMHLCKPGYEYAMKTQLGRNRWMEIQQLRNERK